MPPPSDETIFADALERPAAEWSAFLQSACPDDAPRRDRIVQLLRAHLAAEPAFLSPVPLEPVAASPTLGRYKLRQKLGEGGCGIVYRAEQDEPVRREVAIKVIKLGMDTKEVIARFEAERQALALMEHPNIARVLDGGATDTGRPYFVMELVRGVPITKFCDDQQLSTAERLRIFIQVCAAVQHAHQKGVIHRDLKPSNILVALHDGRPVPKVIDFGIAKATQGRLTDSTLFTAFEQFLGTPAYMSPEQAELSGLDIDTRSDVYSLGVLLYELLTGRPPFDPKSLLSAGLEEIRRIIREVEPPRPSTRLDTLAAGDRTTIARHRRTEPQTLSSLLRGDLDWIIMCCLEKDRTRRYESASALAADLSSYLSDLPVRARPPGTLYVWRKRFRRHRIACISGIAVLLSLLGGLATSTVLYWRQNDALRRTGAAEETARASLATAQAHRREAEAARAAEAELRQQAERSERAARAEAAISGAVVDFLRNDLLRPAAPDQQPDREIKLRTVLDRADAAMDGRFRSQPIVESALRETLGETYQSLGEYAAAEKNLQRSLELSRSELGPDDRRTLKVAVDLVETQERLARFREAEALGVDTLARLEATVGPLDPVTLRACSNLARVFMRTRRFEQALAWQERALAGRRQVLGAEHDETLQSMNDLASIYQVSGRGRDAVPLREELLAATRRVLGADHPGTLVSMIGLGEVYFMTGRQSEGRALLTESLERQRRVLGNAHPIVFSTMGKLVDTYRRERNFAEALGLAREMLAQASANLGLPHRTTLGAAELVASLLQAQGQTADSLRFRQELVEQAASKHGPEHAATLSLMSALANAYALQGRARDAVEVQRRVVEIRKRTQGVEHPDTLRAMSQLGSNYRSANEAQAAADVYAEVLATRQRKFGAEDPETLTASADVATLYVSLGRREEAVALFHAAFAAQERLLGLKDPTLARTGEAYARSLLELRRYAEAEDLLRRLADARVGAPVPDFHSGINLCQLAEARVGLGRANEAYPLLEHAAEGLQRLGPMPIGLRHVFQSAANRLARLLRAQGDEDAAAKWLKRFAPFFPERPATAAAK